MASCISFRFRKPVAKQRKLRMCSTKSIFANGTHRLRNHNGLQAAAIFKRTGTDTVCRFRQLDLTQAAAAAEHPVRNGNDIIRHSHMVQPFSVCIDALTDPIHRVRNHNCFEAGAGKGIFAKLLHPLRQHCRNQFRAGTKRIIPNFLERVWKNHLL